jgi:hypothetical protein
MRSSPAWRRTAFRQSDPDWPALDGADPASAPRDTVIRFVALSGGEASGCPCGRPPHGSVVFSNGAARVTSDVPCRPRRFAVTREPTETRTASSALSSKESGLFDPRRLPSTGAPWSALARLPSRWCRKALSRSPTPIVSEPATAIAALPRRTGFRRSFAAHALSRCAARPLLVVHALFARGREGPRAACRLLQPFAIREHDHDRPSSTAPHPRSPAGAAMLSALIALRRRAELRMAGPTCVGWPVETSRVRGQLETRRSARSAPPTAIARGGSFAPTRSARTPLVASP